uniref:Uncharacterized protein n=1 Tax=Anopheles atroparvus TaxID=41427 RepID=A0AAG5CTY7_ANOAO
MTTRTRITWHRYKVHRGVPPDERGREINHTRSRTIMGSPRKGANVPIASRRRLLAALLETDFIVKPSYTK